MIYHIWKYNIALKKPIFLIQSDISDKAYALHRMHILNSVARIRKNTHERYFIMKETV